MWYHYVVGVMFVLFFVHAVYSLFTQHNTTASYIAFGIGAVIQFFVLRWAYNGITAPVLGGRR